MARHTWYSSPDLQSEELVQVVIMRRLVSQMNVVGQNREEAGRKFSHDTTAAV